MPRREPEELTRPFQRAGQQMRRCDAPDCGCEGLYRAPVSRERLSDYYWFCLDHVREYNRAWNYFAGLDEDTIERLTRYDTVWQRPSWPFTGGGGRSRFAQGPRLRDPFGFFREDEQEPKAQPPNTEEQRALAILELSEPVTFAEIRQRYRLLVKKHHPDANGGDKMAEERLKLINQAYGQLKAIYS